MASLDSSEFRDHNMPLAKSRHTATTHAERQKHKQRLRAVDHDINNQWTIAENSVTVNCRGYVTIVLLTSGILVVSGLAIGFFVGESISGVDPFGITTFCWILAGFVTLVMKSIKVENWPWKDFMYSQVVRRGVNELAANTKFSPQEIITFLLHSEQSHVLYAAGPYNVLFSRQSQNRFAIDVKIDLDTIMRSGFVVVKVSSDTGGALICVDVRRNVDLKILQHCTWQEKEAKLMCIEVPSEYNELDKYNVGWSKTGWNRVVGIYSTLKMKFH
jgi:hypothetical protein